MQQIEPVNVLGIDVGTAITGWGVVSTTSVQNKYKLNDYGVIRTPKGHSDAARLQMTYEGIVELIDKYKPTMAAVEGLYFFKNQKTIISVSQSRGVILLALASHGVDIHEYTPLQVKTAVAGYGRASKQQVQQMVKTLLNMEKIPKPDDAADGIAIALCHLFQYRFANLVRNKR